MSHLNGIGIIVWIYLITNGDVVLGQVAGSNAVALTNGQTMLDCLINTLAGSWWRRTTDGTNNVVPIASDCSVTGNNAAYYRAELLAGNICRLTIGNATMQQAGVYNCFDGGFTIYRNLVTIIDPVASVVVYNQSGVVADDHFNISCSINYTGPQSPAPSLRPSPYWTTSPGQNYTSTTYHQSTNVVTLIATVTVQRPTVPVFQCNTVFEITGDTTNYNATAPADNFTVGNTTELHVQYPPENISINSTVSPKDKCVSTPANLICTADANPPAQYNWVDIINNITTLGAVKSITSGGQYQCTAYNAIRNQTYNVKKTAIEVDCYPVNNMTISGSNCENNTCTCTGNQSSIMLTCMAVGTPNPDYKWSAGVTGYTDFENGTIEATINGNYRCISTNEYGGITYNATGTMGVSDCQAAESTIGFNSVATMTQPSSNTTTEKPHAVAGLTMSSGAKAGIGIACAVIVACVVATFLFFFCHYNKNVKEPHSGTNGRSGEVKTKRNKVRLDRRFPWLKKMLPCSNDPKEDVGSNCLWVSLFILLGTFTGIVTFPILILLSKKSEKNNGASALNLRGNGDVNENTANGRRSVNSLHSPSQPDNQTRAVGQRQEDPYQNESRENIELNSSAHSRNLLLTDSLTSNTSPKGKPPPPPSKPTVNNPGRAQNYVVTEDPNHTTYADLPFMPHVPPTRPVQFLDGTEDAYAELKKT